LATLIEFEGKRPRIDPSAFIAPTAVLLGDVEVGQHASIWFGAVLRADFGAIHIGPFCNVQDNVVIHSDEDTILKARVSVGHSAVLQDCFVGEDSLIGMGAILLHRSRVGSRCVVAAGSIVKEDFEVPDETLAAGNPAVNKKKLSGSAADWVIRGADDYLKLTERYRVGYRVL
jgi:carbonic anhydrase/acetyltransferase-like protein (isoleucine patch superfamily)